MKLSNLFLKIFVVFGLTLSQSLTQAQINYVAATGCISGVGTGADAKAACAASDVISCCEGTDACVWPSQTVTKICDQSCNEYWACNSIVGPVDVGVGSCVGLAACYKADGAIGDGSCVGQLACREAEDSIGAGSCLERLVCYLITGPIGDGRCLDFQACREASGVGAGSCFSHESCKRSAQVGDCVATCGENIDCPDACLTPAPSTPAPQPHGDPPKCSDHGYDFGWRTPAGDCMDASLQDFTSGHLTQSALHPGAVPGCDPSAIVGQFEVDYNINGAPGSVCDADSVQTRTSHPVEALFHFSNGLMQFENIGTTYKTVSAPAGSHATLHHVEYCFRCDGSSGGYNDPHFKTWTGQWYDYMGECTMVLVHAPAFEPGMALDIHIRTKIRYDYSYIEAAAVKIGDETLEVASFGYYSLNGIQSADLTNNLSGFPIVHTQLSKQAHSFEIHLSDKESIVVKVHKDMVTVKVDNADMDRFDHSHGLMGDFETGDMLARNGTNLEGDTNAFASEWQVRDEPTLFQAVSGPQYPQQCILPDATSARTGRRLGQNSVSLEAAQLACAAWSKDTKEACIHDVLATGDLDLAAAEGW